MKYILMMGGTRADADWYAGWTQAQLQANGDFITALKQELEAAGVLAAYECLAPPAEARRVRAGEHDEPITDGIFPESKEFLAGYWIINVDSAEEACRVAARISAAPGNPGHGNTVIEVRQVLGGEPNESA